jgi:hypothetical protein
MRSTITIYVTFIHTDRLANLLHRTLDSGGDQQPWCVLLALREMVSMIGSWSCQSGTRRANPAKYGRSRAKTGGYGRWTE